MVKRPKNEEELKNREAIGLIRASRFVRKYARSHKSITIVTIRQIHNEIFRDVWPEIAGNDRIEPLEISGSNYLPPHHLKVSKLMNQSGKQLSDRLAKLDGCEGVINNFDEVDDEVIDCIDRVVEVVAWIHHLVTHIHPFREGNGRTARLAANLILERYGLVGISVKIEQQNKTQYCNALHQIDTVKDYQPLKELIYEGLSERYMGAHIKYYIFKGKNKS